MAVAESQEMTMAQSVKPASGGQSLLQADTDFFLGIVIQTRSVGIGGCIVMFNASKKLTLMLIEDPGARRNYVGRSNRANYWRDIYVDRSEYSLAEVHHPCFIPLRQQPPHHAVESDELAEIDAGILLVRSRRTDLLFETARPARYDQRTERLVHDLEAVASKLLRLQMVGHEHRKNLRNIEYMDEVYCYLYEGPDIPEFRLQSSTQFSMALRSLNSLDGDIQRRIKEIDSIRTTVSSFEFPFASTPMKLTKSDTKPHLLGQHRSSTTRQQRHADDRFSYAVFSSGHIYRCEFRVYPALRLPLLS